MKWETRRDVILYRALNRRKLAEGDVEREGTYDEIAGEAISPVTSRNCDGIHSECFHEV